MIIVRHALALVVPTQPVELERLLHLRVFGVEGADFIVPDALARSLVRRPLEHSPHAQVIPISGAKLDPVHQVVLLGVSEIVEPMSERARQVALAAIFEKRCVEQLNRQIELREREPCLHGGDALGMRHEAVAAVLPRRAGSVFLKPLVTNRGGRHVRHEGNLTIVNVDSMDDAVAKINPMITSVVIYGLARM